MCTHTFFLPLSLYHHAIAHYIKFPSPSSAHLIARTEKNGASIVAWHRGDRRRRVMKAKKKIALLRSPLGDIRAIRRRGEIFDNFSPPPPPPSFSSASFSILSMEYWTLNGEACFLPDGEDEGRISSLRARCHGTHYQNSEVAFFGSLPQKRPGDPKCFFPFFFEKTFL